MFYQILNDAADALDATVNSVVGGSRYFRIYKGNRRTVVSVGWHDAAGHFDSDDKQRLTLQVGAITVDGMETVIESEEWSSEIATGLNYTTVVVACQELINKYLW